LTSLPGCRKKKRIGEKPIQIIKTGVENVVRKYSEFLEKIDAHKEKTLAVHSYFDAHVSYASAFFLSNIDIFA